MNPINSNQPEKSFMRTKRNSTVNSLFSPARSATSSVIETNDVEQIEDNELEFKDGDQLMILRRGDENEIEWWWAKHQITEKEGYVPRNDLGVN